METRTDLKDDERIEKTVFVKAPRATKYGEVVKVIDAIKGAGANPVGLQVDDLP
jgi:biopolymer transport protein ExbD